MIRIILSSTNMGDVDETDFELWAEFVAETIDEALGFEVHEVDRMAFGEGARDDIEGATWEQRDAIRQYLSNDGWEKFCGDVWAARRAALMIATQAEESAKELLAQGWQGDGASYDLAVYTGDREALDGKLGREATPEERRALEASIRALLTAQHQKSEAA